MELQIFKSRDQLNRAFTELLKTIIKERDSLTVALSGGSTPKSLFNYWSSLPKGDIEWSKIKLFWGDERCVPPDDDESNYKMTKEHLLNHIQIPDKNIFRIRGEESPADEAKRYGELLQIELKQVQGAPVFDIIMLGMGDDGHTASIFPHQIKLWQSSENCVVATHPDSSQKRVSITGRVINSAKNIVFLITGEEKAERLQEIMEKGNAAGGEYPASLVQPKRGSLFWFVDEGAAKSLSVESPARQR